MEQSTLLTPVLAYITHSSLRFAKPRGIANEEILGSADMDLLVTMNVAEALNSQTRLSQPIERAVCFLSALPH